MTDFSTQIKNVLNDPYQIIKSLARRGHLDGLSDIRYIRLLYYANFKHKLALKNPKTYNEKIQWMKLYDRNPLYTQLVDKYKVRDYVKEKIGAEYLIPLYGVWDSFEEIDFDSLPNEFVLKTNHDSNSVVICKDKNQLDIEAAKQKLTESLNRNYYYQGRQWAYKNVKPKIVCEKYMVDSRTKDTRDYKFYCFHGEPKIMFISSDRGEDTRADFFDIDFNFLDVQKDYKNSENGLDKPINFEKMKEISRVLSAGFPHVRLDYYEIDGKIYFGEFTFYSGNGFSPFHPHEYDELLGSWFTVSPTKNLEIE